MLRTFKHGTHPPAMKITQDCALEELSVPEILYIPLSQHIGAPAKAVVNVGDHVLQGQLLGEAASFVSANVYSSVSGEVTGIEKRPTAIGMEVDHIVIKNDYKYESVSLEPLENPTKEQIFARIKEAGIVGMGGATFPTHVKLSPKNPVDVFIINAAECEPYITCDYRLLLEKAQDIIDGIHYVMKVLDVKKAYIGVEANKPKAIEYLASVVPDDIAVMKLKTKYPQGAEKQLIYSITKRIVPAGGLPADVGCVVSNTHTCYSIARAIAGEPCFKRAMTVSGQGVEKKGNYWVLNGTPYSYIYEQCRGNVDEKMTHKIISGGPMMGFAQVNLNACTAKGSSSLLFLSNKEFEHHTPSQCINCGRCINHCPMNLKPRDIDDAVQEKDYKKALDLGVMNCIECGVCSYSCPAKRTLVQSMKLAKKSIKERGIK